MVVSPKSHVDLAHRAPAADAVSAVRRRVGLVCDLVEENWPSMDLVAAMLFEQLEAHYASEFAAALLRPSMRRRFTRLPFGGRSGLCFNADRLLNRFGDYPRWMRRRKDDYDLFHIVDHSYAQLAHVLPGERTVITCHDLDTFRCLLEPERENRPRWFRAMTERILEGLQRAAHVITPTGAIRNQILRHRLLPAERVTAIPWGVDPVFTPVPDASADQDLARLLPEDFRAAPLLLNVGSVIARKRIDVLLKVFAAVRRELPQVRLVRVGGGFAPAQLDLLRELGIENAVAVLPALSPRVLAAAYRLADFLLQTSEAEGFGLPVIEALACGCPVVASDIEVLREVGGPAADYCPVAELDAWKTRVIDLIREKMRDQASWQLRSRQGTEYAANFSWAETARRTTAIYRSLLLQTSAAG